jgi:hypothetical protein
MNHTVLVPLPLPPLAPLPPALSRTPSSSSPYIAQLSPQQFGDGESEGQS